MKYVFLIFTLSAVCFVCFAEEQVSEGWTGNFGLGIAATTGNTETTNASLNTEMNRTFNRKVEWLNSLAYLYAETDGIKTAESTDLKTRMNLLHSERFYSFYELVAQRDIFKDYDYRLMPAVGVGYKAVKSDRAELSLYTGVTQVYTEYDSTGDMEDFTGIKVGDLWSYKFSETAELKQLLEITPDIDNTDHYLVQFELGLSANVTKNWALNVNFVDKYDSEPSDPLIEKNDTALTVGISRKF